LLNVFVVEKKGHLKKDCPMWKPVCEEEIINAKPKVGVNVAMVEWDQPLVDVCVMTHGKKNL
jgi:hypothetical protein